MMRTAVDGKTVHGLQNLCSVCCTVQGNRPMPRRTNLSSAM
jgi:hypothetical protein